MKSITSFVFLLLITSQSFGQIKLKVGDKTHKLNITDYLQNEPKDKNFDKKFVLLEFWATWCTSCLAEVPNLNQMQERFKNHKILYSFLLPTNLRKRQKRL